MTSGRVRIRLRWPGDHWLVLVIGVVASLATASAFWLALQTIDDAEDRIELERLGLVKLAAAHADHILTEAFFELEVIAELVSLDRHGEQATVTNFSAPLLLLDTQGQASVIGENGSLGSVVDRQVVEITATLALATDRFVSESFVHPATGHPTVALTIPVFDDRGGHTSTVVGLLDIDEHIRHDLAEVTTQFGASAHADIINAAGAVLASTEHAADGTPGHHAAFYRNAASERVPTVGVVPHADGSPPHVVAYAPMGAVPWGVALGGSEADAFRAPDARRRDLATAVVASALTFALGMLLVTVEVRRGDGATGTPR